MINIARQNSSNTEGKETYVNELFYLIRINIENFIIISINHYFRRYLLAQILFIPKFLKDIQYALYKLQYFILCSTFF